MTIEHTTFTLPAHLAGALINGDLTGYDESDIAEYQRIVERLSKDGWHIVSCADEEPRFTWSYRLYSDNSASGGSVLDYLAHRTVNLNL